MNKKKKDGYMKSLIYNDPISSERTRLITIGWTSIRLCVVHNNREEKPGPEVPKLVLMDIMLGLEEKKGPLLLKFIDLCHRAQEQKGAVQRGHLSSFTSKVHRWGTHNRYPGTASSATAAVKWWILWSLLPSIPPCLDSSTGIELIEIEIF